MDDVKGWFVIVWMVILFMAMFVANIFRWTPGTCPWSDEVCSLIVGGNENPIEYIKGRW